METWRRQPGATAGQPRQAEQAAGVRLPADHTRLLRWSNGGRGYLAPGQAYIGLWGTDDVVLGVTEGWCVLPGVLLVGDDGARERFALDYRPGGAEPRLVMLDLTNQEDEAVIVVGASLRDGIKRLAAAGRAWDIPGVRRA